MQNTRIFLVNPGDYLWIPFNISVPVFSTTAIELAVLSEMVDHSNSDGKYVGGSK